MKGSFACALVVLLLCIPSLAARQKSQFKVKAAGGTTRTQVGDTIELALQPDVITAVDRGCPPFRPVADKSGKSKLVSLCPVNYAVTLRIKPASITGVAAGASAHYVSIAWLGNRGRQLLIFEASGKNYSSIVSFLEQVTGEKPVDADAAIGDHPLVALNVRRHEGLLKQYLPDMASDFKRVCPSVRIAGKNQQADFTVVLHKVSPTNQIPAAGGLTNSGGHSESLFDSSFDVPLTVAAIYDQNKRRISFSYGINIKDTVKSACTVITREWGVRAPQATGSSPAQ